MDKNSHLMELQSLGHLEVFRADLDEEGSFDDAVAGCDYAFLVAAPVNLTSENPEVRTVVRPPPVSLLRCVVMHGDDGRRSRSSRPCEQL